MLAMMALEDDIILGIFHMAWPTDEYWNEERSAHIFLMMFDGRDNNATRNKN